MQVLGSIYDSWDSHKDDIIWRKFWALWELRRKWKWADWFYQKLDRVESTIVSPDAWSISPGEGYLKLCMWIALLRSVHEGITEKLDSFDTPEKEKTDIKKVFPDVPKSILTFPVIKGSPFRDFRNAIFHCQWSPTLAKFQLDQTLTDKIEKLHHEIGTWIEAEFRTSYHLFAETYNPPKYWLFDDSFTEWMPESFY